MHCDGQSGGCGVEGESAKPGNDPGGDSAAKAESALTISGGKVVDAVEAAAAADCENGLEELAEGE